MCPHLQRCNIGAVSSCRLVMGGLFSKKLNANSNETAATSPDGYSWDKRTKVDASLFTVANQQDQVIVRTPGSLNGNNFVIENCQVKKKKC